MLLERKNCKCTLVSLKHFKIKAFKLTVQDHCLEILRLNVQCNADVGVFTFYLLEDDPLPWPELNSWHQCRNFDKVREWALDNSVGNMERGDVSPN